MLLFPLLTGFSFAISCLMVLNLRDVIHFSIDTIYVALTLALVMPSFVLGDYSIHPGKMDIEWTQPVYCLVGGILTWVFHYN